MSEIDVDFLPPSWRARRAQRRTIVSRVGASSLILLTIAATQGFVAHRSRQLDVELAGVAAEHSHASEKIAKVEELDHRRLELAGKLELLKDVLKRARGAELIGAIGRAAPQNVAFDLVEFHVNDLKGTPAIELTVQGTCLFHDEASLLAENLRADPSFSAARLVYSQEGAIPGLKEFVITGLAPGLLDEPVSEKRRERPVGADGEGSQDNEGKGDKR